MTGRLFWKIFAAFLLTFLVQGIAIVAVLTVLSPKDGLSDHDMRIIREADLLALAATTVARSGPAALSGAPGGEAVTVRPLHGQPQRARAAAGERVVEAGGVRYALALRALPSSSGQPAALRTQFYINMVALVSGLLSATGLAYYFSRPIRSLRQGLEAFAEGNLAVRLGAAMGGRRDEIADLARDFDVMANRVEQLVRARERLIDDVSHELRTPLTRLQLAIALARQRPDRTAAALDRIENEIRRLDRIVGELLTLSRLESGATEVQGYFDLTHLLLELIADARFESPSVRIETNVVQGGAGFLRSIQGDAELIRRAIENILRNAIRHAPAGSVVEVATRDADGAAEISIGDHGPGATPDILADLFEPFVRGAGGGFGLGLAIARRAVLAHGGQISAVNRRPTGLVVTITLPVSDSRLDDPA